MFLIHRFTGAEPSDKMVLRTTNIMTAGVAIKAPKTC